MLESLYSFYKHYYLTHLLLVIVVALLSTSLKEGAVYRKTTYTLLNSLLLALLVIEGANFFMSFLFRLFGQMSHPEDPVFRQPFGYFLLLLYHGIATWVGLLLLSRPFRQSTFFTIFMALLANVHVLVDVFEIVDWWVSDGKLGYDLASFVSIRPTPNILIREIDLITLSHSLSIQVIAAFFYLYYQHFLHKSSTS